MQISRGSGLSGSISPPAGGAWLGWFRLWLGATTNGKQHAIVAENGIPSAGPLQHAAAANFVCVWYIDPRTNAFDLWLSLGGSFCIVQ